MAPPFTLLFLVYVLAPPPCHGFKICAFNVQSFGDSKSEDGILLNTLTRIVSRCDVCLLQEVRDFKKKAIPRLLKSLNKNELKIIKAKVRADLLEIGLRADYDSSYQYDYVSSERLGRTLTYQEQYVFVFRLGSVRLKDQYQYPDKQPGDEDAFAREPFVVRFKAPTTVIGEFVLIPMHTTPTNATKEIDELYDVFEDVRQRWKTEDIMFLGDFNAACGYVAKKNKKNIRLYTVSSFTWLIDDKQDTTVRQSTDCAYDRIVVHGDHFLRAIVPSSARAFNFAKEYRLDESQALKVSDHYPIEVDLKTSSGSERASTALSLLPATFCLLFLLQL